MYLQTIFFSILIASYKSAEKRNKNSVLFDKATDNLQTRYDDAIQLLNQDKPYEAMTILGQILKEDPNFVQAYFQVGKILLTMSLYEDAEKYFTKTIELVPEFADAYFSLGNIYYHLKKFELALEQFAKFLDLDPQQAEGHHNYAATLREMGKLEESIPFFKKSIELNNKFEKAYLNLGITLKNLYRKDESVKYLKKAILLDDTLEDAHLFLGIVYHEQNQYKKAIKAFQKVIKLNPKNKEAHFKLANCLLAIDDIDVAQNHLDIALNIDDNYILALVSRGILNNQLQESGNPYEDLQKAQNLIQNETMVKEQNIPEEKIKQLKEMFDNLSMVNKKKRMYQVRQDDDL